jgi:tetraacyldisaccharide 4'-kinase
MREWIRAWTEAGETFVLEVIFEQRRGHRAAMLRAALFALSKIFQVAVKTRRFLYNVRMLRDTTLGVQVIAIGNLTVGGTGKTPVVEKFARELRDQGRTVAILSRGYRSKPPPLTRRLINRLFSGASARHRGLFPTANRSCSIPKLPGTSRTCSRRTLRTSLCWWTRTG